ncbi:DUF6924 domain-containing protein [Micromonospora sp. CPCC 205546]|uniref:DUF6924 domain-containing protein n=1 Tax=Micromonospora sp. CPCC 205546 TaxID=3122397 RepID=UPI003FA5AB10
MGAPAAAVAGAEVSPTIVPQPSVEAMISAMARCRAREALRTWSPRLTGSVCQPRRGSHAAATEDAPEPLPAAMAYLPDKHRFPVIHADFRDDALWDQVRKDISRKQERAPGQTSSLSRIRGWPASMCRRWSAPFPRIPSRVQPSGGVRRRRGDRLIAGTSRPRHWPQRARDAAEPFRVVPEELHSIETNLPLSNMDFRDFARAAHRSGGVYRG